MVVATVVVATVVMRTVAGFVGRLAKKRHQSYDYVVRRLEHVFLICCLLHQGRISHFQNHERVSSSHGDLQRIAKTFLIKSYTKIQSF